MSWEACIIFTLLSNFTYLSVFIIFEPGCAYCSVIFYSKIPRVQTHTQNNSKHMQFIREGVVGGPPLQNLSKLHASIQYVLLFP